MSRLRTNLVFAVAAIALCEASSASAQVVGTFRWQFAPYCNVVTVLVEQKGAVYELTGTDDGCNGAVPAATANGSAHVDAGGLAGGSLTLVRHDGFVITNRLSITPATLHGTWQDNWGNSGSLVFNPPAPVAGAERPLMMRGDLTVYFSAAGAGNFGSTSVAFPQRLPSKPVAPLGNIIPPGGAPTANCPGSISNPLAAPGQVCVYTRAFVNIAGMIVADSDSPASNRGTETGFGFIAISTAAGGAAFLGRWAVGVP